MANGIRDPLLLSDPTHTPTTGTSPEKPSCFSKICSAIRNHLGDIPAPLGVAGTVSSSLIYAFYSDGAATQLTLFASTLLAGIGIQSAVGLAEDVKPEPSCDDNNLINIELTSSTADYSLDTKNVTIQASQEEKTPLTLSRLVHDVGSRVKELQNKSPLDHSRVLVHHLQQKLPVPIHFFFLIMYSVDFVAGTALSFLTVGMYGTILTIRASRFSKRVKSAGPRDITLSTNCKEWWKKYWMHSLSLGIGLSGHLIVIKDANEGVLPLGFAVLLGTLCWMLIGKSFGAFSLGCIDCSIDQLQKRNHRGRLKTTLHVMRFALTKQLAMGGAALFINVQGVRLYVKDVKSSHTSMSIDPASELGKFIKAIVLMSLAMLGVASGSNDYEFLNGEAVLFEPNTFQQRSFSHYKSTLEKTIALIGHLWKPIVTAGFAVGMSFTDISVTPEQPLTHNAWFWIIGSSFLSYYARQFLLARKKTSLLDRIHVDLYLLSTAGLIVFNNVKERGFKTSDSDIGRYLYMICGGFAMGITQHQLDMGSKYSQGTGFKEGPHGILTKV